MLYQDFNFNLVRCGKLFCTFYGLEVLGIN